MPGGAEAERRVNKVSCEIYCNKENIRKQIAEKNRMQKSQINATSYQASSDDAALKIFLAAEWVKIEPFIEIPEASLVLCVKERSEHRWEGESPFLLVETVNKVNMQMSILDRDDRVWSLRRDYVQALRAGRYGYLSNFKPYIASDHTISKLKFRSLSMRWRDIPTGRKDERFHRNDFNIFLREVTKLARKLLEAGGSHSGDFPENNAKSFTPHW